MQTLRKKSSPGKYKNEPSRFMGEGVSFKAKLIGILEVADARGDRMCQDALSDLKMAIRAAGEHKQRIVINMAFDGLRLRDEKTGDCLYHHPVHKISFIAQDMTDNRAFGYIFGSPDSGHRFFGIKTDKSANQVIAAMRDLFQAVFELRKKELAESRHNMAFGGTTFLMGTGSYVESIARQIKSDVLEQKMMSIKDGGSVRENGLGGASSAASSNRQDSGAQSTVADLLDLEFENNLHSPSSSKEDLFGSDPFGDSFTKAPPVVSKGPAVACLPPPPSEGTGTHRRRGTAAATSATTAAAASSGDAASLAKEKKPWFDQETEALFDESELTSPPPSAHGATSAQRLEQELLVSESYHLDQLDVFTELDPLGTGRSKPYVHKKDFFQDLKNPPKKVLKDLVGENQPTEAAAVFQTSFEPGSKLPLNGTESASAGLASGETVLSAALDTLPATNTFPTFSDPFSEDPFDKTDPFSESSFVPTASFSPNTVMQEAMMQDPFESSGFADFSSFSPGPSPQPPGKTSPQPPRDSVASTSSSVPVSTVPIPDPSLHGPLRVTLPPEKPVESVCTPAAMTSSLSSSPRQRSRVKHQLHKQSSMGMVKLTSPKSGQRARTTRISKQITVDGFTPLGPSGPSPTPVEDLSILRPSASPSPPVSASSDGDALSASRLSASSAELADIAPEPPPRPAPNNFSIKPPPLPPKKQHTTTIYKPPPRPPYQEDHPHYDHIENYESSSSPTPHDERAPPIPVPMRRPRYTDETSAPQRPRRPIAVDTVVDDGYLSPSPLLPPPLRRTTTTNPPPVSMGPQLPTTDAPPLPTKTSLDITLSQLSKTGFSDLAATLGMSPSQLSKMTLQELTKCLENLSVKQSEVGSTCSPPKDVSRTSYKCYKSLNESVDEEPTSTFSAEFEDNFDTSCIQTKSNEGVHVQQQSLFDKYAVFRELLEQDNYENKPSEGKSEKSFQPESKEDTAKSPSPSPVVATTLIVSQDPSVDRYAALREIALCDEASSNKDDEEGDEDGEDADAEGDAERDPDMDGYVQAENEPSDKEDSLTEVPRNEEDQDLLTLSAQHSESTESPTNDTTTVKDTLSIMETTIMEEETYIAEGEAVISVVQQLAEVVLPVVLERQGEEDERKETNVLPKSHSADSSRIEDTEPTVKEGVSPVEVWAKFDSTRFEKPPSDEAASPWSSDGKEYSRGGPPRSWKDDSDREVRGRRRRTNRSQAWREDEESEEGCEDRWGENGWSDRESLYDDRPAWYPEQRRSRRRKVSPWRKSKPSQPSQPCREPREPSPWDCGDRTQEEEKWESKQRWNAKPGDEDDDEMLRSSWKTRPKNLGSSWEEEHRRCGSWEDVTPEYEDVRKRRPSPWSGEDRRSSRESMTWGEDERYQRRRYDGRDGERERHRSERRWRPEKDEEYRRRRDIERDRERCYGPWPRKNASGDYSTRPHRDRHYRDHSHESPWDEGEDSPHFSSGSRESSRKWRWSSRPGSGSAVEGRRSHEGYGEDYEHSRDGRRYRPSSGSVERRSRSRDDAFNSDNEHDYWPEHARSRTERETRYEQRSQTLHSWRSNRYRKNHRSPFEDDFTGDPKSQESSLELADGSSKRSPLSSTSGTCTAPGTGTPQTKFRSAKKDSLSESEEARSGQSGRGRSSCGSSHRQSPFDDDFTPSEACNSGRLMSASSDVSDRFGADDGGRVSASGTAGTVASQVPRSADSGVFGSTSSMEHRNGRSIDDVFLPAGESSSPAATSQSQASASCSTSAEQASTLPVRTETRRSVRLSGDDKNLAGMKARLSSLRRTDSSSSLRKSDSINIFARSCDPFDDDDFFNCEGNSGQGLGRSPRSDASRPPTSCDAGQATPGGGDHMKWTDAFESFNFQDEQ